MAWSVCVYCGSRTGDSPLFMQAARQVGELIARSGGRNLYAKALMAEYYARLVFDQALHDRLLEEVLAADPAQTGFTLVNVLAQSRARELQASGKDFF